MSAVDDQAALAFYRDLAHRLRTGQLTPEEAVQQAGGGSQEQLVSEDIVRQLLADAHAAAPCSPRESWALAHGAGAAAQGWADSLLEAECDLALGVALNALGRFVEVVPLLEGVPERLLEFGRPELASRCYSEIALACTYLGQFDAARAALTHAQDSLAGPSTELRESQDDPVAQAHCDLAEGWFHLEQSRYLEAATLLRRARDTFAAAGHQPEAALAWCDLAETLRLTDPQEALECLNQARHAPGLEDSSIHLARCDYVLALIDEELNRYAESLPLYRQAQTVFAAEGMGFLVALCDLGQGVCFYRLNQYEEALQAYNRAHSNFRDLALSSYVARCDLNRAAVFYSLNRYDEALVLYQQLAEDALAEGRTLRAARCYTNMGLCYDSLGRYDRALVLHDRARQAFLDADSPTYAALCQENLAGTCRRLGRYTEALEHYWQARQIFSGQDMHVYVARCDTHMADLFLALGQYADALACLERARVTCRREDMVVHVAVCDREMGRVRAHMDQGDEALTLLSQARTVFTANGLLVDVALCDLVEGEVYLAGDEVAEAISCFTKALRVLAPSFPDEAWRAHYGLGHCALVKGDRLRTLEHWLSAVKLTNQVRAVLPTEQLSGGFFASRRQLYQETLKLALAVGANEEALAVAEAGKTQTFLAPRWGAGSAPSGRSDPRETSREDPYLTGLWNREKWLRQEMISLRRKLRLLEADETGPMLRSEGELRSDQPQMLARLAELAQAYEEVVERLRLVAPAWLDAYSPAFFSLSQLRQAAKEHLPAGWKCLSYYLLDDTLVTFYLDSQRFKVHRRTLNVYDRLALRQCTDPARDFRELIYRGTIRGHRAPETPGRTYLRHLYGVLIPPAVEDFAEADLLLIAPHGPLHELAFQALLDADGHPLVTQVPLAYVPSLSALQSLLREPARADTHGRVLACGLSDFGSRARPLPHAADEVAALQNVLGEQLHVLWGRAATRDCILRLNEAGELAGYDVIHFATHAVLDRLVPSQSRVLLADGSLALADILNLRLGAQMVVLSVCEGAIGQPHPGDEIMGLARAFLMAGARTVVASLWPVEDASAGELMGHLYRRLERGEGIAQALRSIQIEMADRGWSAYQWAPFVMTGRP